MTILPDNFDDKKTGEKLLERFTRYVKVETTSHHRTEERPTSEGQWTLLKMLQEELREIGIADTALDDNGFLIARIPAKTAEPGAAGEIPVIGFMAHVDTAEDVSGKDVKPQVHEEYDGSAIRLNDDVVIDPEEFPELLSCIGETVITSDGTTLLGADDKAGVAEIVTAAEWLLNSGMDHGAIELILTPDEETGKGMDLFPLDRVKSTCCYTMDGDGEGVVEAECFYAYLATVTCTGLPIHPGSARGKLANAVSMAAAFLDFLPRNESPEATDGRFGFFCPTFVEGGMSSSRIEILIRDFELSEVSRREEMLQTIARSVEAAFPGSSVAVDVTKQYSNMRKYMERDTRVVDYLREAVRLSGAKLIEKSIRGGTDGARLSEMGIPAPNIFAGGANFHSVREWASLRAMVKAVRTILNLIQLWGSAPRT